MGEGLRPLPFRMKIPTLWILPDEGCHGLYEGPRTVNGKRRWIQAVYVVRNDTIAEWTKDYGPAENFPRIQPVIIPGLGDDSVAEVQAMAEKNRHDTYWADRADEMLAESTLIKDHIDQLEKDQLRARNRSVIGPAVRTQRNGYSRVREKRTW